MVSNPDTLIANGLAGLGLHGKRVLLITHRLPLAEFAEGVEIMRNRTDVAIKVVLEP